MSSRTYTIGLKKYHQLPQVMGHLTWVKFYDYFTVKYLKSKHRVCANPFWLYWRVGRDKSERLEIPKFYIDECLLHSKERFVYIPLCLVSPKSPGGHANALVVDTKLMTAERFEPHGGRAYDMFDDFHYERFDEELEKWLKKEYTLTYIPPISFCPKLGPQSFEHYIEESGYCATWSLWYVDMRLTYPDVPKDKLVFEMFNKLHVLLSNDSLDEYLIDYAKQVYFLMVSEYPQYEKFFVDFDKYDDMSYNSPKRKAFNKFLNEMEALVKDPLFINKPVIIPVGKKKQLENLRKKTSGRKTIKKSKKTISKRPTKH